VFNSTDEFEVVNVGVNDVVHEEVTPGNYRITLNIQVNIQGNYTNSLIRLKSDNSYAMTLNVKQIRWDKSTPTKMIKYADLLIGGQTIQRITGDYIYMYNQLMYTQNDSDFTLVATTLHNSYPIINPIKVQCSCDLTLLQIITRH